MSPEGRRKVARIAIELATLVGAFALGRITSPEAPARVVERVKIEYRDRVVEASSRHTTAEAATTQAVKTVTVTRWLKSPDGTTTVEARTEAAQEARSEARTAEARVEYRDREVVRLDVRESVREAPARSWRALLVGGAGLDGRRLAGLQVQRDLGPLVVGASVVTPIDAARPVGLLSVGVLW